MTNGDKYIKHKKFADLVEQTTSLITIFNKKYDNAAEMFAVTLVECLVDRIDYDQVRQIIDCAAARLEIVKKLKNIPVYQNKAIILLPVHELVSVVAHAEKLHLYTIENELFTVNMRLKELELRLQSFKFIRLSRGSLVNLDFVSSFKPMSGGTYQVTLANQQQLTVSRIQSQILRKQLLRL